MLIAVEQEWPARLEDARRETLANRDRLRLAPSTVLPEVRKFDPLGDRVDEGDIRDVGVERLARPLADQLDERRKLELGCRRLADLVDGRELGCALAGFEEEAGILESDAKARGEGTENPLVGLAECVDRRALEPDDADRPVTAWDGDDERRTRSVREARSPQAARPPRSFPPGPGGPSRSPAR